MSEEEKINQSADDRPQSTEDARPPARSDHSGGDDPVGRENISGLQTYLPERSKWKFTTIFIKNLENKQNASSLFNTGNCDTNNYF